MFFRLPSLPSSAGNFSHFGTSLVSGSLHNLQPNPRALCPWTQLHVHIFNHFNHLFFNGTQATRKPGTDHHRRSQLRQGRPGSQLRKMKRCRRFGVAHLVCSVSPVMCLDHENSRLSQWTEMKRSSVAPTGRRGPLLTSDVYRQTTELCTARTSACVRCQCVCAVSYTHLTLPTRSTV